MPPLPRLNLASLGVMSLLVMCLAALTFFARQQQQQQQLEWPATMLMLHINRFTQLQRKNHNATRSICLRLGAFDFVLFGSSAAPFSCGLCQVLPRQLTIDGHVGVCVCVFFLIRNLLSRTCICISNSRTCRSTCRYPAFLTSISAACDLHNAVQVVQKVEKVRVIELCLQRRRTMTWANPSLYNLFSVSGSCGSNCCCCHNLK